MLSILRWLGALAFVACSTGGITVPGTQESSTLARQRAVLERHDWIVTFKDGHAFGFHGLVKLKHAANGISLEMRMQDAQRQVNIRNVASVSRDAARVSTSQRHTSFVQNCHNFEDCCGTLFASSACDPNVADSCDASVYFCCYVRGGSSLACNEPQIVFDGTGCEFDQPCGDDGNGNVQGVGYFIFSHHYCWYDFATGDISCFFKPPTPPANGPKDLYSNWIRAGSTVRLFCKDSGTFGRGLGYYYDIESNGVVAFGFLPGLSKVFTYPDSFPGLGKPYSVWPASIESEWYQFGIPIPSQKIGICNHVET